jgi:hypothetical protein
MEVNRDTQEMFALPPLLLLRHLAHRLRGIHPCHMTIRAMRQGLRTHLARDRQAADMQVAIESVTMEECTPPKSGSVREDEGYLSQLRTDHSFSRLGTHPTWGLVQQIRQSKPDRNVSSKYCRRLHLYPRLHHIINSPLLLPLLPPHMAMVDMAQHQPILLPSQDSRTRTDHRLIRAENRT